MSQTKIAACIVTFNRLHLLRECIDHVRKQSLSPSKILVCDNGSSDGSREWLKGEGDITLITTENENGCAGAFSRLVNLAFSHGADFVWLMDDDCIPDPCSLETLLAAAAEHHEHSYFCSQVKDLEGRVVNQPRVLEGGRMDKLTWSDLAEKGLIRIESCSFVSVLVSRSAYVRHGGPLPEMHIWGDDLEYTLRLSRSMPGLLVSKSKVTHAVKNHAEWTLSRENNVKRIPFYRHLYKNRLYVIMKYGPRQRAIELAVDVARQASRSIVAKDHKLKRIYEILAGLTKGSLLLLKEMGQGRRLKMPQNRPEK